MSFFDKDECPYRNILHRYADDLGIGNETETCACEMYESAMKNVSIRDMDEGLVIATCLYIACRKKNEAYDSADIADAAGIKPGRLSYAFRLITRQLNISLKPVSPLIYIPRISDDLNLSDKARTKAIEITDDAIGKGIVRGKNPKGVAAAAIYLACESVGEKMEKRRIADIAGVTETTINIRCNDLEGSVD